MSANRTLAKTRGRASTNVADFAAFACPDSRAFIAKQILMSATRTLAKMEAYARISLTAFAAHVLLVLLAKDAKEWPRIAASIILA